MLLLIVPVLAGCSPEDPVAAPRPPVILIGIDTVRGDHVHAWGNPDIMTPNLDRLATDGVLFRRCQSTAPWTGPSFASILTGLLPYHHGFIGGDYGRLAEQFTTLGESLQGCGYATASFVTIRWLTRIFGLTQGFAVTESFFDQGKGLASRSVTDGGLAFAAAHRDEPFFLFLHYFDAHAPYTPPPPYDRLYYEGDEKGPGEPLLATLKSDRNRLLEESRNSRIYDWLEGVTDWEFPVKQYAAGVTHVDDHVGQVLLGLEQLGLYDEAMIIVVSDHGEHLTEHGFYFTHSLPYQEAVHVPLLIKWPGGRFAGSTVEERVSTVDILPTVLAALDLDPPAGMDGVALTDLAGGISPGPQEPLFSEQGSSPRDFCKSLVKGDWKLIWFRTGDADRFELYDLARDPGETDDLADRRPDILDGLRAGFAAVFAEDSPLSAAPPVPADDLGGEARKRLRSLGYIH
ncbi:MAG: sulfatase [Candidatus Krumholzibacteriia bacterium]